MEGARAPFAVYQFIDRRVVTLALSAGFCDLFGYSDKTPEELEAEEQQEEIREIRKLILMQM